MAKRSAAMLVYRFGPGDQGDPGNQRDPGDQGDQGGPEQIEVLIGHMGGPLWARKDAAAWSIPKGEYEPPEEALVAARREFEEEVGSPPPAGPYLELGEVKQPSGKIVTTFAVRGDHDLSTFASNLFDLEWPRGSGKIQQFPELDRAEWFDLQTAATKLVKGQVPILDRLADALRGRDRGQVTAS